MGPTRVRPNGRPDGRPEGADHAAGAGEPSGPLPPWSARRPHLGAARADRAAGGHGRAVHLGARRLRVGQRLLLGSSAGRHPELEGVLLRLQRLGQLHHRRQATRLAVGDGAFRAHLRCQLLEHPGAASAGRRGRGRVAVRHHPALVRPCGRPARRRGDGAHPGGRADVPLQQPRCTAGAADGRCRLHHHTGDRGREDEVVGVGRRLHRLRVPHQDAAGLHRRAGARTRLLDRRPPSVGQAHLAAAAGWGGDDRRSRVVGGHRRAVACRQ